LLGWISLSLISALFLGLYDIAKKSAVKENAVPPVLLFNTLTAAVIWLFPLGLAASGLIASEGPLAQIVAIAPAIHFKLFLKAVLAGSSWILAFFALKHLPISIATPIRSTSPLWTILIAVAFLGERPSVEQWMGILLVLLAFFAFSRVGAKEGIPFHRDRAVALMVGATLLGSASALYDKYLLQSAKLPPVVVQAWFSIYLVPVMMPMAIRWWRVERADNPFQWRWSIPLIAVFLLVSDFTYFTALADPAALLSVVSPLRRASMLIAFLFGIVQLKEHNWKAKAPCIAAILAGVFLLSRR
jgi:drug/metabolite transporter (DMT)-like permease